MSGHYSGRSASASPVPPQRNRRFLTGVSCDNAIYGCSARLSSPEERIIHKDLCDFEPNSCVKCIECHKEMKRSQLRRHNCIEELRAAVEELKDIITALEAKVNQQSIHLNEAKQILDASPHQILTHRQLKEKWIESYDRDNDPKREVVFESEPDLTFKEVRHLSGLSDTQVLPEVNAYKRYDKQMATDVDDFGMYGSLKYKYLSQLSREFSADLPPIDYDLDQSLDLDLKKRNKEKLIDVHRDNEFDGKKPSLVRLRSWSERHTKN